MMGARNARVTFLALTAAAILATSARAQTVQEAIEVTIENVDVVVVDSKGRPVTGLTRDDFELIVDGDPTPIANFYEQSTGDAELAGADRGVATSPEDQLISEKTVLLYFDATAFGQPLSRGRLIDATKTFVTDLLENCSSCQVGLFSRRGRELHTLAAPSRDAVLISKLLDQEVKVQHRAAWAQHTISRTMESDMLSYPMARHRVRLQHDVLSQLVASAIPMPGRKILALVTNQPLQYFPDASRDQRLAADHLGLEGDAAFDRPFAYGPDAGRFSSLVALCNAAGVSVYPIIAGGLAEMESLIERGSDFSRPVIDQRLSQLTSGVRGIADATGGRLQHPTNNFVLPFAHIDTELRSYYSLGFRPSGKSASIRVRVPGRDVTVRSRRALVQLSAEEIARIQTRYGFDGDAGGPVRLEARVLSRLKKGRHMIATVGFNFPIEQITWLQRGDENRADLELLFSAIDDAGRASAVSDTPLVLRRDADDSTESFSDTIEVALRDASQDLLVVLRDTKAETTSWTTVRIE
ncbi:MAG TPA: VWA domain-containing protein [Thermoanaerobaculia bacterium]|nr:VWA domain-containing protein [Thermoanaerobaculia bacterium]